MIDLQHFICGAFYPFAVIPMINLGTFSSLHSQYLTRSEDDHIPSYPNLVEFELGRCSYDAWKCIAQWLAKSPRLEKLIFGQGLVKAVSKEEKWPSNVALIPFTSRVKVIEVYNFRGYTTELVLLKYLLKNTKVLKKLILYKDNYYAMTFKQQFQVSKKLLMLPRASSTCVVQFRKPT
ncbi:hypothetical protein KSS87_013979 [Heliosperma pusillum]|nr:hypothetical protein KSS87_013979 [Heliosperma pusillum]